MVSSQPIMNCHSTISVLDLLGTTVHTREASVILLKVVENDPCDQLDLDFAGVAFISRSFADQFHADKINLAQKSNKSIIVTNANESIINMLQAVSRTQHKTGRHLPSVPVYKYSDRNVLERFLLSF
ncbi:MAG: hypothetical protein ACXVMS_06955 [Flavisolibacter sp.]